MNSSEYARMTEGYERFSGKELQVKVMGPDGQHIITGRLKGFTSLEELKKGYRFGVLIEDPEGTTHWTTVSLLEEAKVL